MYLAIYIYICVLLYDHAREEDRCMPADFQIDFNLPSFTSSRFILANELSKVVDRPTSLPGLPLSYTKHYMYQIPHTKTIRHPQ